MGWREVRNWAESGLRNIAALPAAWRPWSPFSEVARFLQTGLGLRLYRSIPRCGGWPVDRPPSFATHWRYCDKFAERFPDVTLERDPIWVQDDWIWSSAEVTAGIDLTMALVERDFGIQVALEVARELVVFLKRPGGQSQFSNVLSGQMASANGPLETLFAWIADNLGADLRAETLADKAGMSLRTFCRTFSAKTGKTPAKAVELFRIQAARDAVLQGDTPLGVIAARCGFGDEQRMRRAFVRQFNATPADMRARFSL